MTRWGRCGGPWPVCAAAARIRGCSGADLVGLAGGSLWVDVRALWDGSLPATEIGGTLLEGVQPRNCPAFGVWLMLARGRCAARSMEELRRAALGLLGAGDAEAAIEPAGRGAALDLLDEGAQELFLHALVAAGHPAWPPCTCHHARRFLPARAWRALRLCGPRRW